MVKIRLTRLGKHKSPFYRIVAVDSKCKRDGDFIELIGTVNPKDGAIKIDEKLTLELLNKGAQPSETIKNFLKQEGI
jgi:small subunit ribosomal protein S16